MRNEHLSLTLFIMAFTAPFNLLWWLFVYRPIVKRANDPAGNWKRRHWTDPRGEYGSASLKSGMAFMGLVAVSNVMITIYYGYQWWFLLLGYLMLWIGFVSFMDADIIPDRFQKSVMIGGMACATAALGLGLGGMDYFGWVPCPWSLFVGLSTLSILLFMVVLALPIPEHDPETYNHHNHRRT